MDYFKLAGGLLFVSSGIIDLCRGMGITPTKSEIERRKKSKADPRVKWDPFDELSYSVRLLLPRMVTWLGIIGVLLWSIS